MKKLFSIFLICLMSLALCGCGSNSSSSGAFKLGGSGPLTGGAAEYGKAVQNAAKLAVDEVNALNDGVKFELNIEDDEHDAEKAVNCFASLMDWGMQVSLDCVTSAPGIAVAQKYKDANIFAITPSGSNQSVTLLGDGSDENAYYGNIFQMCFTDPNQGIASADYLAMKNLGTKIAIFYEDDIDYSKSIYDKFKLEAANKGLNIVFEGSFQDETQDFSTLINKAKEAQADLVFLPIYYQHATLILDQAKKADYAPIFFGVDGMDGILTQEGFEASLAEGVYYLTPFSASSSDSTTVHFVNSYKEKYGSVPNQFAADAYDCVYLLHDLIKNNGITVDMDNATICNKLVEAITNPSYSFNGITGISSWNKNGQVSKEPKAVIIKGGETVEAK